MNTGQALERQGTSLVIRPNRSLPVAGMVMLFMGFTVWALAIGIGFTLAGLWLALPFAGLEVLAVGLLCGWLYRHRDDCELITIEADRVYVVKRQGNDVIRHDFPRYWMRVRLDRAGDPRGRGRLSIGSHGRFITLGEDINDGERTRLAHELQRLLRLEA